MNLPADRKAASGLLPEVDLSNIDKAKEALA
jgi:hypothetical protein